ncbi:hypothetical protein HY504_01620 [Candidatus Wolfebacteria bacterium]|nr:hypothetical protein [Candidatus Wolfebacteria bacterium]
MKARQFLHHTAYGYIGIGTLTVVLGLAIFLFWKENILLLEGTSAHAPARQAVNAGIVPPQPQLSPLPQKVNGIYLTSWSAGSERKVTQVLELIKGTSINAVVVDLKDYSGYVGYDSQIPEVMAYKSRNPRIRDLNALIKRFHDAGIYVIGRITVFQDPVLAKARPDIAIHSKRKLGSSSSLSSSSTLWLDQLKLAWVDPASRDTWDYVIAIGKEASSRGVDELNFDYVRFPADGRLDDMIFPISNASTAKRDVIRNFFAYLRDAFPDQKISADIFGMALINTDDSGIGQVLEDVYSYFDYVSPMIYPSHFYAGFLGYKNPAAHPYEVVKYSMEKAIERLTTYNQQLTINTSSSATELPIVGRSPAEALAQTGRSPVKLRPWLQSFNLGATYTTAMIRAQIEANAKSAGSENNAMNGFLLWDPQNRYNKAAL